jgi:uncharacterized membrane protein
MKISFTKAPIDLFLCFIWSALLAPLAFFSVENPVRLIMAVPFILFIPGYILMFVLFPLKQSGERISILERIGLSLGVSLALAGLFGLGLNYTPWGIRLDPLLLVLCLFIFGVGSIALYRWHKTNPEERFNLTFHVASPAFENKPDKVITIILTAAIIVAGTLTIYMIVVPKIGERFTEFYVLGPTGTADKYPQNLSDGQNATVIIGISNHEYRTVNYSVGIWLVNQSTYYNVTQATNITVIHHMWFMDEITVTLNHTSVNVEEQWNPQWQYNYSFNITRKGHFKLTFVLFTSPMENYTLNTDYKDVADILFNDSYREVHLWINVI